MESVWRSVILFGRKWTWTNNADAARMHLDFLWVDLSRYIDAAYCWIGISLGRPLKEKGSVSANVWKLTVALTLPSPSTCETLWLYQRGKQTWSDLSCRTSRSRMPPTRSITSLEDRMDCLVVPSRKGAFVLAPVAFWANYPGLYMKWDGIKDQDRSGVMTWTFGGFETEKKRLGVPSVLISLVFHLSS